MLKYGPTINIETNIFINIPKMNIPPVAAAIIPPAVADPKIAPENPNIVNINPIIIVTTLAMDTVMIINPR